MKINGVRVEPAEIESAIAAIVDIDFCATILQPNTAGTSILLTYVWSHRDTHLDGDNLRRKLADVLPAYMVPAAVVVLESAPPVVNGKLDARALPAPEKSVVSFEPPHTDIERTVAEAFAAVLGNHEIGRGTHFFDHGGNSLLATQVSSRLRTDLRRAISLKLFFAHPTVAELAAALEESPPEPDITTIAARTRPEDIPLSRQQHRMWVLNTLDTSSSAYNLPLAVDLRGRLDRAALEHAVNEVLGKARNPPNHVPSASTSPADPSGTDADPRTASPRRHCAGQCFARIRVPRLRRQHTTTNSCPAVHALGGPPRPGGEPAPHCR